MAKKGGPGKPEREGLSVFELADMFPTEDSAGGWFEKLIWPNGRYCPRCGNTETAVAAATSESSPMTVRPASVHSRYASALHSIAPSLPLRKWAYAIFLEMTCLKGISSMKLHRDDQGHAKDCRRVMLHRSRATWKASCEGLFAGPVEVDETYMSAQERNMRGKILLRASRGTVDKSVVIRGKDRATNEVRAEVVEGTDAKSLQGFVANHAAPGATVYTAEAAADKAMPFEHDERPPEAPASTSRRWPTSSAWSPFGPL